MSSSLNVLPGAMSLPLQKQIIHISLNPDAHVHFKNRGGFIVEVLLFVSITLPHGKKANVYIKVEEPFYLFVCTFN